MAECITALGHVSCEPRRGGLNTQSGVRWERACGLNSRAPTPKYLIRCDDTGQYKPIDKEERNGRKKYQREKDD